MTLYIGYKKKIQNFDMQYQNYRIMVFWFRVISHAHIKPRRRFSLGRVFVCAQSSGCSLSALHSFGLRVRTRYYFSNDSQPFIYSSTDFEIKNYGFLFPLETDIYF